MRTGYEPTDEQQARVARLALEAAYEQVKHLAADDPEPQDAFRSMLKAFAAASSAQRAFDAELLKENPGFDYVSYYGLDIPHVVCSAVLSLMWGGIDDTHPYNFWAARFVPLMKAAQAMEAYSSLISHAEGCDMDIFGEYGADDILRLAATR